MMFLAHQISKALDFIFKTKIFNTPNPFYADLIRSPLNSVYFLEIKLISKALSPFLTY